MTTLAEHHAIRAEYQRRRDAAIALLRKGRASTSQIATAAGITPTQAESLMHRLKIDGLTSSVVEKAQGRGGCVKWHELRGEP